MTPEPARGRTPAGTAYAVAGDGEPLVLVQGQAGYIPAGRIHDARYVETCRLVYVHDKAFGFQAHG